jgi:hypothetical protein
MTARRAAAHAPRPTLPPAATAPRLKRLNVDLVEADHRALKAWAVDLGLDASQLIRAMLELTRSNPAWADEVAALAQALAEGGRGARP